MDALVKTDVPQPVSLAKVNWCGFKTIIIREYGRIIRIWGQTLVHAGDAGDAVLHDL